MSKMRHINPALPLHRLVLLHLWHTLFVIRTLDSIFPRLSWLDLEKARHTKLERALELAIVAGSLPAVRRLVAWGADFRISQDVMLSLAVMKRRVDIVEYLLNAGADPTSSKSSAFQFALMSGDANIHALLSAHLPEGASLAPSTAS